MFPAGRHFKAGLKLINGQEPQYRGQFYGIFGGRYQPLGFGFDETPGNAVQLGFGISAMVGQRYAICHNYSQTSHRFKETARPRDTRKCHNPLSSHLIGSEQFAAADAPVPVDLDVHVIAAHGSDPAHHHHDVRFVLVAAPGQTIFASDESTSLEWFDMDALEDVADDDSVLRLGRKVRRLLEASALQLFA
jgi:hypothetical protein